MSRKKYGVVAMIGYDNRKVFSTNNICTAVKRWMRWDNKYPSVVGIWSTEADAKELIEYCINNMEWFRYLIDEQYSNPSSLEYRFDLIREVSTNKLVGKSAEECRTQESSIDEIYPFCRG